MIYIDLFARDGKVKSTKKIIITGKNLIFHILIGQTVERSQILSKGAKDGFKNCKMKILLICVNLELDV